jgi:group II intron reverse transcriptase/maturase
VRLDKEVEPIFHEDSYGYRAGKSAIDAVKTARQRNFEFDWVLDLDISKFFDSISHELLMKAVCKHSKEKWVVLYVERFLKAPTQYADGRVEENHAGTPQGGVISPLLANLYLHYAFDMWMAREYPAVNFERYADDVVIHCRTEQECDAIKAALTERMIECGLQLHPQKTQKVYCKDYVRRRSYERVSYTFLGYTFKPRAARSKSGRMFTAFSPSVSRAARKELARKLRAKQVFRQTHLSVAQLASAINPVVRGWLNYFRHFRREGITSMVFYIEGLLIRWVKRKFRLGTRRALRRIALLRGREPHLFSHWSL